MTIDLGEILADIGDIITCPNGHHIYRVAEVVRRGDGMNARHVTSLHCEIPHPPPFAPMTCCPECQSNVWVPYGGVNFLRFDNRDEH